MNFILQRIDLNRVGRKTGDFTYVTDSGLRKSLHDSEFQEEYLVLCFGNPGCAECSRSLDRIEESLLGRAVAAKKVAFLAVSVDADLQEWLDAMQHRPEEWIRACADGEELNRNYDLKAVPTYYLLDRERILLVKDGTPEYIELFLEQAGVLNR